jgi:phage terminase large subunit GpA-like protein
MTIRETFPGLPLGWSVFFSAMATAAAPPPEMDVPTWSDEFRKISAESGARKTGDWDTAYAPYMRRPMVKAGVDQPNASVWLRWSAKSGKTQVFVNAAFHCIDTAPRSIGIVCASDQKQKDFEKEVWSPNAKATAQVALKILAIKAGSEESSTKYHKKFRGGFLKIINGGSEAQLQQSDIGLLIFEEPSSYPKDVGGRGPTIRQARSRSDAWGDDLKELGGGTPNVVGDCVVTDEVERRTLERYYMPCPHCGGLQLLIWENMQRRDGRPYFVCQLPDCGKLIGHEHKRGMLDATAELEAEGKAGWLACFEHKLKDGSADKEHPNQPPPPAMTPEEWAYWYERRGPDIGTMLEGRDPSFDGIWQAYSPFTTWARIWEKFDEASNSGKPQDLVVFWQQVLARPFEASYDRPATETLFEKREIAAAIAGGLTRGVIPPWAWTLFGAADVQGDRLEWAVWAVGPADLTPEGAAGRLYGRIDAGIIPIPPVDPRAWTELAEITRRTYGGAHIHPIGFDRFGVDTGGHHTSRAYAFCAGRPNVMALKGASHSGDVTQAWPIEAGTRRKAKIGKRVVGEVQLYLVSTHKVKKDIYFGLAQTLAGCETGEHLPGSVTLEATATELDFQQITAEVLKPADPSQNRKFEVWEPVAGTRNEQLDMAVYCHAMAWSYLPEAITLDDWKRLIAARRREPSREGQLPLEGIWSGAPPLPPPTAGQTPVATPPPRANAVREPSVVAASHANHALMRLARLNGAS